MRFSKIGHACVRLEKDGATLVVDPGAFSPPEATDGADAVLITHEHADHFVADRLRAALRDNPRLRVWTNQTVSSLLDEPGDRVRTVGHGDTFSAAGFDVEVHGSWHAVIHPDIPRIVNIGFLVDGTVFHPGDAFTVPERPVDTLLVPSFAPWSKTSEVMDYLREVNPARAIPVHDAPLNEIGLDLVDRFVGGYAGEATRYTRTALGESVELG